jgi:hypothetical protein
MAGEPAIEQSAAGRVSHTQTMSTKLDKTIRREIEIDGEPFTITISPEGFRLTRKRFRSGVALSWKSLWTRHHGDVSFTDPSDSTTDR